MQVRDFEDLIVWQKSVDLAVGVYALTKLFPKEERFQMTSQLRKAAVSVSSNIAEGNGRWSTKDYIHFLINARGSLFEVRSLLVVSRRFGYATEETLSDLNSLCDEIGRMPSASAPASSAGSNRSPRPLTPDP